MERRVITTDMMEEDIRIEGSLRPQCLDDYIGHGKQIQCQSLPSGKLFHCQRW